MRYLYLTIWLAVASPFAIELAHAQIGQAGQDALEQPVTAFERALATTAAVVKGVKITLNSVEYERGETLGMELNLREIVGCSRRDCQTGNRSYSFKDSRSVSLSASLAPIAPADARLGNWRTGATWVVYDETSLFREEARARLLGIVKDYHKMIRAADVSTQRETLWRALKDETRNTLEVTFNSKCAPGEPDFAQQGDWGDENDARLASLLQAADVACRSGTRADISRARKELVDMVLDQIRAWSQTLTCEQEVVPVSAFPIIASAGELWSSTWNSECAPRRQEVQKKLATRIEEAKRELATGVIVSVQGVGVSRAELLAPMGADDVSTIKRAYHLEGAVQASYRWLGKNVSADATAKVARVVSFDARDSSLTHTAALNIEIGPGRINGSSIIVGADASVDGLTLRDAERRYFAQGRLAFPLHERVFLLLSLRAERDQDSAWVRTPSFALSWSYDLAGKTLARQISFLQQEK